MVARRSRSAALALLLVVAACTGEPQSPPTSAAPAPQPAGLAVAEPIYGELVFASPQGQASRAQLVSLSNSGVAPLELSTLAIGGPSASSFSLSGPAPLPLTVEPGTRVDISVSFNPAALGVHSASLDIATSTTEGATSIALYGLGTTGEVGDGEPSLQQITETLGYSVDVGGDDLELGSEAIGEEVLVPMFERAGDGPVTLTVVARYSADAALPFGYFTLDGTEPVQHEVGLVGPENAYELSPPLETGSATFDPGTQAFGIYGAEGRYSLDPLNRGTLSHAFRVYPLLDRSGKVLPNSYLLALEAAGRAAYQDAVFVLRNVRPSTAELPDTHALEGWEPLFNGKDLSGWYTYLLDRGRNNDPEEVFRVEDGTLHILDVPDRGYRAFGYLATKASYRNYHLRLQYKWGDKRFEPRKDTKRDSGLIYHVGGRDGIWPRGVELQIQEGDTGDFWMIDGTTIRTTVENPHSSPARYDRNGKPYTSRGGPNVQLVKDATHDHRNGWNTVDLIVRGSSAVHRVNGKVNNRAQGLYSGGDPLGSGKILLQAEGAEIYYRNIELRPLGD